MSSAPIPIILVPVNKTAKIILLATLLCCWLVPAPARAGDPDWAWGQTQGQGLGAAALIIGVANAAYQGAPPIINRIKLLACGAPDCNRQPIEVALTGPSTQEGPWRFFWIQISLPPGNYRLSQAYGTTIVRGRKFPIKLDLNMGFKIRQGRSAYLGRLEVVLRHKSPYKPKSPVALKGWTMAKALGRKNMPDLSFERAVKDQFDYDATEMTRLMPNRLFLTMEKSLLQ